MCSCVRVKMITMTSINKDKASMYSLMAGTPGFRIFFFRMEKEMWLMTWASVV